MPDSDTKRLMEQLKAWTSQERGRQSRLASLLGVSRASVSEWLAGKIVPSWETGRRIEIFLAGQKPGKPKKTPKDGTPTPPKPKRVRGKEKTSA